MTLLRNAVRDFAYTTGVLALHHRLRHAATLTIVMFHRVAVPSPGTPTGRAVRVHVRPRGAAASDPAPER